jgi:hypothetical protein
MESSAVVGMILNKCGSEIEEVRKQGRQCNMQVATDLGECARKIAGSNVPELRNTSLMVVIQRLTNANDIVLS